MNRPRLSDRRLDLLDLFSDFYSVHGETLRSLIDEVREYRRAEGSKDYIVPVDEGSADYVAPPHEPEVSVLGMRNEVTGDVT